MSQSTHSRLALWLRWAALGALWLPAVVSAAGEKEEEAAANQEPTHKQVRVIKPEHDGKPVTLNTFCLDAAGQVVACVARGNAVYQVDENGNMTAPTAAPSGLLQRYSPDGELLQTVALAFQPTAVNQAPDGSFFVAGAGQVAHVSCEFEILASGDSPHLEDRDAMREKAVASAKQQLAQITESMKQQLAQVTDRIAKLEETPADELTERDKARLAAFQQQQQMYEQQLQQIEEQYSAMFDVDTLLEQAMGITALAVTNQDLFLCCRSVEGRGYEVWRMNHDLSGAERILTNLLGCCGQFDIQAMDDRLLLAENTKFQVSVADREGARQFSFGQRERLAGEGFGSCCNPMNIRCCSNGDIITAESSVGTIKRFNAEGEFLGVVGRAKIGGGCKHVAVGHDESRDRYYLMNVDKSHICVLVPMAEAPALTEEEAEAKIARDGLGQKLLGEWSLTGQRPRAAHATGGPIQAIASALQFAFGSGSDAAQEEDEAAEGEAADGTSGESSALAVYFRFEPDGKLTVRGGYLEGPGSTWEAVRQESQTLTISQLQGGVAYYDYRIEFRSDNEAVFTMMYGDQPMGSRTYKRIAAAAAAPPAAVDSQPKDAADSRPEEGGQR